jgi:DNA-binding LacI/PurR family transcriptional regulator
VPELLRVGPADEANRETVGYELAGQLLDLPDPPTALFTGTNHLTFGALRLIQDRGLRIPDDVALVAFDEVAWMSVVRPPLTVAAQPTYELGRIAAELLLQRIEDGTRPPQEVVLRPTLIIRQSCAPHLGQDAEVPSPEPVPMLGA